MSNPGWTNSYSTMISQTVMRCAICGQDVQLRTHWANCPHDAMQGPLGPFIPKSPLGGRLANFEADWDARIARQIVRVMSPNARLAEQLGRYYIQDGPVMIASDKCELEADAWRSAAYRLACSQPGRYYALRMTAEILVAIVDAAFEIEELDAAPC